MFPGFSWPPTPRDISEPHHGRVFSEKFHSVYAVKGVRRLLTDLLFNRGKYFLLIEPSCQTSILHSVPELVAAGV